MHSYPSDVEEAFVFGPGSCAGASLRKMLTRDEVQSYMAA